MIYVDMRKQVVQSISDADDTDTVVDAINQLTDEIVLLAGRVNEKAERLRARSRFRNDTDRTTLTSVRGTGHAEDAPSDRHDGIDDDDGREGGGTLDSDPSPDEEG